MLYCEKCRSVCPDSTARCPRCKSARLRTAADGDLVLLHRADEYAAGRLAEAFDSAGIVYALEPFSKGHAVSLYDSEVMPTDKSVFVRFSDLEAAGEISVRLKEELEKERQSEQEDDGFEDMPRRKRMIVQTLSILAFLILVMLAVFGADALAGWLKSVFGIG